MIEAEYAAFFRWLPWRKRVERVEEELRWKQWSVFLPWSRLVPPGVFILVNENFFK